jgi:hypothetical protein
MKGSASGWLAELLNATKRGASVLPVKSAQSAARAGTADNTDANAHARSGNFTVQIVGSAGLPSQY